MQLDPTEENIALAQEYVWLKWKERSCELDRPEPTNLSGACKFASLFAREMFGGEIAGNYLHQYLVHKGRVIDLTGSDGAKLNAYHHDRKFWLNPEHKESLISCAPRVSDWVAKFSHFVATQSPSLPEVVTHENPPPKKR
jgi:hypothetical protein